MQPSIVLAFLSPLVYAQRPIGCPSNNCTQFHSKWTTGDGNWTYMLTSKHIFYGGKHTPGDTSATLSGQIVPDPVWHKFLKGIALPQGCDVCDARTCLTSPNMLVGKIVTVHMFNSYTCGFTGPHSYKGRVTPWLTAYEDSGAIGLYYYSIYGTVLMSSVSYVDMTLTDPITIPWWSGSSTMGGDNLDSFMMTHLEAIFDGNVTLTIVLQEEEFGKIPIDFVRSTGAIVWYRIVALWNNFLTFLAIYVLYKMGRPITIPHAVVFMEGVVACSLRSWRRWWDPTYVGAPWVFLISHLSRTLYNAPSQISTLLMCYVWLRMVLTRKFSAAAENVILLLLIMVMAGCLGGLFLFALPRVMGFQIRNKCSRLRVAGKVFRDRQHNLFRYHHRQCKYLCLHFNRIFHQIFCRYKEQRECQQSGRFGAHGQIRSRADGCFVWCLRADTVVSF